MNQARFTHCDERDGISSYQHICAIYRGTEERMAILMSYIAQGLQRREQIICAGERFITKGRSVRASALMPHQMILKPLRDFMPEEDTLSLSRYTDILLAENARAIREGFRGLRLVFDMECESSFMTPGEFVVFESALESMPPECACSVLCLYNLHRFPGYLLKTILQVHPLVATPMRIMPNSYYQSCAASRQAGR